MGGRGASPFLRLEALPREGGRACRYLGRLERQDVVDPSISGLVDLVRRLDERRRLAEPLVRDLDLEPLVPEPVRDRARASPGKAEVVLGGADRIGVACDEEGDWAEVLVSA